MTAPPLRYPVFVPTKGRHSLGTKQLTAENLLRDGVPFRLVVERSEEQQYRRRYPDAEIVVLPFEDQGSVTPARNWIRDLAISEGHERHWQLDDNIKFFLRLYRGQRIRCSSALALSACETFTDRYTNIGVSGLNYLTFVREDCPKPFYLNCHVYSCCLVWHGMPYRWRPAYNEDTDLCLQVLSGGLCTVALNAFMANKTATMHITGGNTDELYAGDGRARMARSLERQWPYVVDTRRRSGRPQHVVRDSWKRFDTPLIRRTDIDWSALPAVDEGAMELRQVDTIDSPVVRELFEGYRS